MKHIMLIAFAVIIAFISWAYGRESGVRHVVYDSVIWVEDGVKCLEIDGQVHQYD